MTAGTTLREARIARDLALQDAAEELGVAAKYLRALEWDRRDLLPPEGADELERQYRVLLGLDPPEEEEAAAEIVAGESLPEAGPRAIARFRGVAHAIPLAA